MEAGAGEEVTLTFIALRNGSWGLGCEVSGLACLASRRPVKSRVESLGQYRDKQKA